MSIQGQAEKIHLLDFKSPQMRAFHMAWFAFFLCFFAWFGLAPLMPQIREEMNLSSEQIGWLIIGSVSMTILARLVIGWVCDHYGPRRAYTWLLVIGSLPVMGAGLAQSFEGLLIARILIGCIGASFVITQYHTSVMFAPNCVGAANATVAGWGNLGGGVTQLGVPAITAFVMYLGADAFWGWRITMAICGLMCMATGIAYYFLTQDLPEGNYSDLKQLRNKKPRNSLNTYMEAIRDCLLYTSPSPRDA